MTTLPVTVQERIPLPVAGAARPGASAAGLTPNDVLRILRQRIFLVLSIWFLMTGAAIGLTYYLMLERPQYTARAAVLVESPFPKPPMAIGEPAVTTELMNRYVQDQIVLMKDDQVLQEAMQTAAVTETFWYKNQQDKARMLKEFKDTLSVTQIPGTSYMVVSFPSRKAADAAVIVNTVIEKYLAKVDELSRTPFNEELRDYVDREDRKNREWQNFIDSKQRFIAQDLGSPGLTAGINVVGETLRTLTAELTRLEQDKLMAKAAYENLVGAGAGQISLTEEMRFRIQQDPQVSNLTYRKFGLEQMLDSARQSFGDRHRSVENVRKELEVTERKLQEVMAEKEREAQEMQINMLYTAYTQALAAETALRERIVEADAKQRDLDQAMAELDNMEERKKMLETELNGIRAHVSNLQLMIRDRGMVRVRRVGQAVPPQLMSFPQWHTMVPAGSFLGLLLGVGLALLLDLVDTSVRTSRDIIRHVHVPILGTVPDLDDEEVPIERIELAAHAAPRSMVAEAFRTIRTNLLLSAPADRQRTLLVTSSKAEEGKTTVALNLATSIGQSGRRVLLIDANFHRPALHQLFPDVRQQGLSNALIGQATLDELVTPTALPNLDVIGCGPIPPNPTELLSSPFLRELLVQAADRYDQIILDGPPVLLVSDALVLTGMVDGVILVCRARASSRGVIQRAREQLERVNGRIFGAVLNAAQVRRGGYFREQIRSYYDYQPEQSLAASGMPALPPTGNGDGNGAKS